MTTNYQNVEKETVHTYTFSVDDVLQNADEKARRSLQLKQAASLGNLERGKVKIRFATEEGAMQVTTTIWHVSDEHIVLKGGRAIPVRSIYEVLIS